MKYLIILFLNIIVLNVNAQIISHQNAKSSQKPESKGRSIEIKNISIPMTLHGALVIIYKMGGQKNIDSITLNDTRISIDEQYHISKGSHAQGIILIALKENEKVLNGTLTLHLNGETYVRGAIAATYDNVNQIQPAYNFRSASVDSLSSQIKVNGHKGDLVIDCFGDKTRNKKNYELTHLANQKEIQVLIPLKAKNARSEQYLSACEQEVILENTLMQWTSNSLITNGIHLSIILKANQ